MILSGWRRLFITLWSLLMRKSLRWVHMKQRRYRFVQLQNTKLLCFLTTAINFGLYFFCLCSSLQCCLRNFTMRGISFLLLLLLFCGTLLCRSSSCWNLLAELGCYRPTFFAHPASRTLRHSTQLILWVYFKTSKSHHFIIFIRQGLFL
jgi:hypothetical protein